MPRNYIPARDADFQLWAINFAAVIAASPGAFGLVAADATSITAAYTAWNTAYLLAIDPGTRTPVTIAAKDTAKASATLTFRTYAQIIQNNAGVSDANKTTAGLTVRSTGRTPIPAPATAPILGYVGSSVGSATLKYSDTSTPTTKAKPFGATGIELWSQVNPTGTPDVTLASFQGIFTKAPLALTTPAGGSGKVVAVFGRWVTRRGLVGPWSATLTYLGT